MKKLKISGFALLFLFALCEVQLQAQPRSDHHRRYRDVPRYGRRVDIAPRQAAMVRVGGTVFRYNNGIFYRPYGSSFIIERAPVGAYVRLLPPGRLRIVVGSRVYFYYYANFYSYQSYGPNSGYVVVDPPIGAQIDELPDGYHKVEIDGNTYYLLGNVYYKAEMNDRGDVWYEVVGVDHSNETDPINN